MNRAAVSVPLLVFVAMTSFALAQPPSRPGGPPLQGLNPIVRLFDTDRDGKLSPNEITASVTKLQELDKNSDAQLTGDELNAAMPRGRGPGGPAPGGRFPSGNRGPRAGGGGAGSGGSVQDSDFDKPPLAKNAEEQKILTALEAMREGPTYRNVAPNDGRLLRMLAETMGAKRVVEIGTSTGESAVWLALGLRAAGGHLYTHEIDEGRAKTAQENFKKAGVADLITLVLGDAHETVKQYDEPIDMLFLDADKDGYIDYLTKLVPLLRPGGLVVAHNMNTRQADPRFLKAINENPDFETLILLREGTGVSVTLKKK